MRARPRRIIEGKASWKYHEGETSGVRARLHEGETSEIVRWRDIVRARPHEGETSESVRWQDIVRAKPQG